MRYVKFGISCSPSENFLDLKRRWRLFEEMGVDSLWLSDHLIRTFKPESPYRDAWTLLPALAAVTQEAFVGVLVTCNSFRHPAVLGRSILTVDEISNGRLIVGMGAGWYRAEHEILGIPIPKRPVSALESSVQTIQAMLTRERIDRLSTRDYLPILEAIIRPRPIGPCPILIGGHGPRILEIARKYAQIWNSFGTPDEMRHRGELLDQELWSYRRGTGEVERTIHIWRGLVPGIPEPWESVQTFQDIVGMYSDCGLTGMIFDAPRDNQMEVFSQCITTSNLLTESPISTVA